MGVCGNENERCDFGFVAIYYVHNQAKFLMDVHHIVRYKLNYVIYGK